MAHTQLTELFLLYPENQRFLDGDRRYLKWLNPRHSQLGALLLFGLFFGLMFLWRGYEALSVAGSTPGRYAVLGLMLLIMGGFCGTALLFRYRKIRRLKRAGQLLDGVVQNAQSKWFHNYGTVVELTYQFVSPTGKAIQGTTQSGPRPRKELLPRRGRRIQVLYLDDKTFQVL